jgi:shikimate O-hydroxycinnamoyltransferase
VAKRFVVFSKSSIEALIAKYYKATNTEKLQRPSPIDVLSAFLYMEPNRSCNHGRMENRYSP